MQDGPRDTPDAIQVPADLIDAKPGPDLVDRATGAAPPSYMDRIAELVAGINPFDKPLTYAEGGVVNSAKLVAIPASELAELRKRISDLAIEVIVGRRDVQTERDRSDRWRDTGNKYYDIRGWLRICDDDPAGHAEFYKEVAEIIFPEGDPDPMEPMHRAAARAATAQTALDTAVANLSPAAREFIAEQSGQPYRFGKGTPPTAESGVFTAPSVPFIDGVHVDHLPAEPKADPS